MCWYTVKCLALFCLTVAQFFKPPCSEGPILTGLARLTTVLTRKNSVSDVKNKTARQYTTIHVSKYTETNIYISTKINAERKIVKEIMKQHTDQ